MENNIILNYVYVKYVYLILVYYESFINFYFRINSELIINLQLSVCQIIGYGRVDILLNN